MSDGRPRCKASGLFDPHIDRLRASRSQQAGRDRCRSCAHRHCWNWGQLESRVNSLDSLHPASIKSVEVVGQLLSLPGNSAVASIHKGQIRVGFRDMLTKSRLTVLHPNLVAELHDWLCPLLGSCEGSLNDRNEGARQNARETSTLIGLPPSGTHARLFPATFCSPIEVRFRRPSELTSWGLQGEQRRSGQFRRRSH